MSKVKPSRFSAGYDSPIRLRVLTRLFHPTRDPQSHTSVRLYSSREQSVQDYDSDPSPHSHTALPPNPRPTVAHLSTHRVSSQCRTTTPIRLHVQLFHPTAHSDSHSSVLIASVQDCDSDPSPRSALPLPLPLPVRPCRVASVSTHRPVSPSPAPAHLCVQ